MSRLIFTVAGIWLLVGMLGFIGHMSSNGINENTIGISDEVEKTMTTSQDWRSTLKQIKDYYMPIASADTTDLAQDNANRLEQVKLTDAKVVGIVIGDNPQVYLLKPDDTAPTDFYIGDSWLSPWTLRQVEADNIVWFNGQTNETFIQYLFQ